MSDFTNQPVFLRVALFNTISPDNSHSIAFLLIWISLEKSTFSGQKVLYGKQKCYALRRTIHISVLNCEANGKVLGELTPVGTCPGICFSGPLKPLCAGTPYKAAIDKLQTLTAGGAKIGSPAGMNWYELV